MSLFRDFEAFYREHAGRVGSILFHLFGRGEMIDAFL
jgi:hypothetical protein